jgi:glycosyltransferase involved in cell wall biosynthesis
MKVLFITNAIVHYREPLYRELGLRMDFSIAHHGKQVDCDTYIQIPLKTKHYGPVERFIFQEPIDLNDYDVIVIWQHVMLWNLYKSLYFSPNKKYKIVVFGIGVSASYDKHFDRDWKMGYLMRKIVQKADACIFYDQYPAIKYASYGIDPNKLFVVNNTVVAGNGICTSRQERAHFLFVGTLYRQKGLEMLIEAYDLLNKQGVELPLLKLVGDGPDYQELKELIEIKGLTPYIVMLGSITQSDKLAELFSSAIACVSPLQAGLTVQNAFAFGVPFITKTYPISGGEFTSIIEDVTGFNFDGTSDDLAKTINRVLHHPNLDEIYQNCFEWYNRFRSPKIWVNTFERAVRFAYNQAL